MPPVSTYRLQLRKEFGFADAAAIVPYLAALGVTHVYCSPVLAAVPGSPHGYDVIDHSRLSPDLGGEAGWEQLRRACVDHDLGMVLDIVPNHMAIPAPERLNPMLWAMLAEGPGSDAAEWFDVDWDSEGGRIVLPVLGRPLGDAIAMGEVTVDIGTGVVRYFDHEFPLTDGSLLDTDPVDVAGVLDRQHYCLAWWRDAPEALNYRRFFDVTSLIGLRVEIPAVFAGSHRLLLELAGGDVVDGLRVDHPDGLADPGGYLDRLAVASGEMWTVVEKILERGEELPAQWRCEGTTGYDALAAISNVFVDPAGREPLDQLWQRFAGEQTSDWDAIVAESKREVVRGSFRPEVERLARAAIAALGAAAPDPNRLVEAIDALLVEFDVYRAYPGSLARLDDAAGRAIAARPDLAGQIGQLRALGGAPADLPGAAEFATRLAQTTGPVMAKGVEDTALYRFHRLTGLNEVGGDPGDFGRPVRDFHAFCARLAADWPTTMTALSTHDTKRSEDVRARLLVLSEIPGAWERAVAAWEEIAAAADWPRIDVATRYLTWQTIAGAWPLPADRLSAYLAKATREAKLHTTWTDPEPAYDAAVQDFAARVAADPTLTAAVETFVRDHLLLPGRVNALGQKLVQLTMPGVPDVYQGREITDLSLVDPDNRRPVDYLRRAELLDRRPDVDLSGDTEGALKLTVTAAALHTRRERPETFLAGGYQPVTAHGPAAGHVLAFRRGGDVITLVTRHPAGLGRRGGWGATRLELPPGDWYDAITGREIDSTAVGEVLITLPVALLLRRRG